MTNSELKRELRRFTDGAEFITLKQISAFMGIKDPKGCRRYVYGLPRISNKYYFIPDVAERLFENAEVENE